jgi:hypothetical protein
MKWLRLVLSSWHNTWTAVLLFVLGLNAVMAVWRDDFSEGTFWVLLFFATVHIERERSR